jgi:hypothetical protein
MLQCQASGKPLPEVQWTKNGKEIKSNEHLILEALPDGLHRLQIVDAQADLTGQYVATVKHKLKTQKMVFNVLVTGIKLYAAIIPHQSLHAFPFQPH